MRSIYFDPQGVPVALEVPWDEGTNWIPPPTITFRNSATKESVEFTYEGEEG
jgi:hypothetical protein